MAHDTQQHLPDGSESPQNLAEQQHQSGETSPLGPTRGFLSSLVARIREDPTKVVGFGLSVGAIVVSFIAYAHTTSVDSQQATASEHQQLDELVQALARVPAEQDAVNSHRSDAVRLLGQITVTEQADAEEASRLIAELKVPNVAPAESLIVGDAFRQQGAQVAAVRQYTNAITQARALQRGGVPSTTLADAYRNRADSEYRMGRDGDARPDERHAYTAESEASGYAPRQVIRNQVFTLLADLSWEFERGNVACARREIHAAKTRIRADYAPSDAAELKKYEQRPLKGKDRSNSSAMCPV